MLGLVLASVFEVWCSWCGRTRVGSEPSVRLGLGAEYEGGVGCECGGEDAE